MELEKHQLLSSTQPVIMAKTRKQKLDSFENKLEPKEWTIIEMIKNGMSNNEIEVSYKWAVTKLWKRESELIIKVKALMIMLLIAGTAQAQSFELVRTTDFRYLITVDDDTVATRTLEYNAIQDAIGYKCKLPDANVTIHPVGLEVKGCPAGDPEKIYDTDFFKITDTVFITESVKMYDNKYQEVIDIQGTKWHPNVRGFDLEIREAIGDTLRRYRIAVDGYTDADHIEVTTNCYGRYRHKEKFINEHTSGKAYTDESGRVRWVSDFLSCHGIMTYWITGSEGNQSVWFADIPQILFLE